MGIITHGMWGTPTYKTWDGMLQRCNNEKKKSYIDYGGRGIKVCDRWLRFENFFQDMGERPKDLILERIDNNLGYFKGNCKWATYVEQGRNRRVYKTNKTGTAGIYWRKDTQKYAVQIMIKYKTITIGCFTDLQDAITARKNAEIKYWNKGE